MSKTTIDPQVCKPVLNVSIPPDQRAAFYRALIVLREQEGNPFLSISAVVVKTIISAAQDVLEQEAPPLHTTMLLSPSTPVEREETPV